MRVTLVGCKRKSVKRRNFQFTPLNGFDDVFEQSFYSRIVLVKIPRYRDGMVIGCDLYDLLQSEYNDDFMIIY